MYFYWLSRSHDICFEQNKNRIQPLWLERVTEKNRNYQRDIILINLRGAKSIDARDNDDNFIDGEEDCKIDGLCDFSIDGLWLG